MVPFAGPHFFASSAKFLIFPTCQTQKGRTINKKETLLIFQTGHIFSRSPASKQLYRAKWAHHGFNLRGPLAFSALLPVNILLPL